jgi:zinc protease
MVSLSMLPKFSSDATAAEPRRAHHAKLDNGMEVVVIPDRRAPVVTHMVWYRTGAADEKPGVSGIAHFLEHLMFKGTAEIPPGEFSKIIARNGGQDNAFTTQDTTAYYQRVAKDRLPIVMKMEADRMANLRLVEKDVLTERDVILEERRSRVENNPSSIFGEMMSNALFLAHPYRLPVIGWEHEIAKLSQADALAFYKQYYAPNNAILVVAGDVEADEVMKLARETYGKHKPNPALVPRHRIKEPPQRVARRLSYRDPRAGKPMVQRLYIAPSYGNSEPGEAEALDLLLKIMASGATGRVYKRLVVQDKIATSAGGYYGGTALDYGRISLYAVTEDAAKLSAAEALLDEVVAEVKKNGVTEIELARAKKSYLAEFIQESDSQSQLARRYGWGMTTGMTIKDIEEWPDRIAKVTVDDVKRVAVKHLVVERSVTGTLLPDTDAGKGPGASAAPRAAPSTAPAAAKPGRS